MNTRTTVSLLTVMLGLGLGACGGEEAIANFDTEGWIDTMPPSQPPPKPFEEAGGDEEDEEGEEEEGEEEGEEDPGAWLAAWGLYENGEWSDPAGELFATDGAGGTCIALFDVTILATLDDCSECVGAWEIEFGGAEIEEDEGGMCAAAGVDSITGMTVRLGHTANDVLMIDDGSGWAPVEDGEASTEEGELFMEWAKAE